MKRVAPAVLVGSAVIAFVGASGAAPPLPESGSYDLSTESSGRIAGAAPADRAGWSVTRAGDLNGDGRGDVVVGAPHADRAGAPQAGAAYVLFGPATPGDVDLGNRGAYGFRIDGANGGDWAGWSTAALGDVNGDGLGDIAVGAPFADSAGGQDSGAAYVVYGKADTQPVSLGALAPTQGRVIAGVAADDRTGFSVNAQADTDGDGRAELLIGAPTAGTGGTAAPGAAFLLFSKALQKDVDLTALGSDGYRIDGTATSLAGVAVSGMPDLNGDQVPEVVVGAPGVTTAGPERVGGVYVLWGKNDSNPVSLSAIGGKGFVISGGENAEIPPGTDPPENARTAAGWAGRDLSVLGDVNGDGQAELLIGAPHTTPKQRPDAGAVYVVFGKSTTSEVDLSRLDGAGVRIAGAASGDLAGWAVRPAGDFDDDGTPDVLLGAPAADALSREDSGAAYVIFGRALTGDVDLAGLAESGVRLAGAEEGERTGGALTPVGDVSGDGVGDLLVGTAGLPRRTGGARFLNGPKEEPPAPDEPPPPPPDPGVEEEETIDRCEAARNVEVVVDDSGSMESTDPEKLRREAIELLLAKERNAEETIGAVQFGSEASQIFPPTKIDPFGDEDNRDELEEALDLIDADDGGTNYNAAFDVLVDENPGATGRIFLTDGGHNEGEYRELHRGGAPTFVIGFGIGRTGVDGRRLQRIAGETGGRYFANVKRRNLQRAMNAIDSRLNCDIELDFDEEVFDEEGEVEEEDVEVDEDANSADIVVSWGDTDDEFELVELTLTRGRRTIARIGRTGIRRALARGSAASSRRASGSQTKPRRLRVAGRRGTAFITLRALGLERGQLNYRVRAKKLRGRGRAGVQISQSRRVR